MILRCGQFNFTFPRPALIMGVVNVTPDSFSDGGRFLDTDHAVAHGLELMGEGAEILDIGGESTRPGAIPVSESEEIRRVIPVIEKLKALARIPISIDTMKPAVARAAAAAGASIINDVAANRDTDEMWRVAAETGLGYVCMHMQGTPQTMQTDPSYRNILEEVSDFFSNRLDRLNAAGVAADQVVLDVGFGFGKTFEHNLQLLAGLRSFTKLGRPLLVGVSRKSFLGKLSGATVTNRLPGSLAGATLAVGTGANIVRAHDVAETVQAVRLTEAIMERKQTE
jgi:dihydropteroate synthase